MRCDTGPAGRRHRQAVKWTRKAADQGHPLAANVLGIAYSNGLGVPQDYVLAHMWFNIAASRFPASDAEGRDEAVNRRDGIARKMSPEQIAEAQRLAREWKPQ
jgi:uncharacterized protein